MNLDTSTIDRIVAGVLTQLGTDGEGASGDVTTETRRHGEDTTGVVVANSVVTADVLLESMEGESRIIVAKRAIVTPAAWDAARERGVEIVRESSDISPLMKSNASSPSVTSPLLIVVRHNDAVERLFEDVASTWRRETLGCPDDAAALAISAICRGESSTVVILVEQTHRAACLTNRNERIQAVAVTDAGDVRCVRTQLKANTWCVDPTGRSWFELRNLLRAITSP